MGRKPHIKLNRDKIAHVLLNLYEGEFLKQTTKWTSYRIRINDKPLVVYVSRNGYIRITFNVEHPRHTKSRGSESLRLQFLQAYDEWFTPTGEFKEGATSV